MLQWHAEHQGQHERRVCMCGDMAVLVGLSKKTHIDPCLFSWAIMIRLCLFPSLPILYIYLLPHINLLLFPIFIWPLMCSVDFLLGQCCELNGKIMQQMCTVALSCDFSPNVISNINAQPFISRFVCPISYVYLTIYMLCRFSAWTIL